jgi:multidrug efflux pump subunit AcrA (membrane-fusion protein)
MPSTRTLKARVELPNPGNVLVPGMFVNMQFMDMRAEKSLLIPTEAVIQTGKRVVVMLAEDKGKFRPVEVETGIESNGQTSILRGLQSRAARGGVVAVPDRLGSQFQRGRGSFERRTQAKRCQHRTPP